MADASAQRIAAMREGGKRLGVVKHALEAFTKAGMRFEDIEAEAQRLIAAADAKPNFAMVPGYHWATCIMRNAELCHGIPQGKSVADGDVLTIDVGLLYNGFHLDTTTTFIVGQADEITRQFVQRGREILDAAIFQAKAGNSVYDVSLEMEQGLKRYDYGVVYQLTGHGIGTALHMEPAVPVFADKRNKKDILRDGQTIAIEVMYTAGSPDLVVDSDGWTYRTKDGGLSGMFEETVLVTKDGPEILTK